MFAVIALLMSAGSMIVASPTFARHDDDRDNNRYERDRDNQDQDDRYDQDQWCDRECCGQYHPQDKATREERE